MTSIICLHFSWQEEDNIEQPNAKCPVFTLMNSLLAIMLPRHKPHNTFKHLNIKISISALYQVSCGYT